MSPTDDILESRQKDVLKSVIRAHIVTGEPVGSRTVSRGAGLDLSPATIRNIMAELEEHGLLVQPHTSAGRVPTDLAYRLYVDRLMGRSRMSAAQTHAIDEALERSRGEIPELLEETSRQLSRLSSHVGVVLAPEWRRIVVEQLEFVRLGPHRVVTILVGRSGVVHNRILEVEDPVEQAEASVALVLHGGNPPFGALQIPQDTALDLEVVLADQRFSDEETGVVLRALDDLREARIAGQVVVLHQRQVHARVGGQLDPGPGAAVDFHQLVLAVTRVALELDLADAVELRRLEERHRLPDDDVGYRQALGDAGVAV